MKTINCVLLVLIGFSSFGLVYSLSYVARMKSKLDKQSIILNEQRQISALLYGNMKMHYTYSQLKLSDVTLLDSDNNKIMLSDIIGGQNKLVFKLSLTNCSSCIQHSFFSVRKFFDKLTDDKFVVIADNSNRRELRALMHSLSLNYPIYITEDSVFDSILNRENLPFFFVIGDDLQMKDLFIPIKELPDYSDLYYRILYKKYFSH